MNSIRQLIGSLTYNDVDALMDWVNNQDPSDEHAERSVARQRDFCVRLKQYIMQFKTGSKWRT